MYINYLLNIMYINFILIHCLGTSYVYGGIWLIFGKIRLKSAIFEEKKCATSGGVTGAEVQFVPNLLLFERSWIWDVVEALEVKKKQNTW